MLTVTILSSVGIYGRKRFVIIVPEPNIIKLFTSVIYEFPRSARVFFKLGWKNLPGRNTIAYYENS
jgi:hypothetical protein